MRTALAFDGIALVALVALSALVRSRFHHRGYFTTSAFGAVMAIGIFAIFSLPQLPFYTPVLARLVTIETLVIWLFLVGSCLASAIKGRFGLHLHHPLRRFAIGTWVAGTAVLAILVAHAAPEAVMLGKVLALLAVAIYLPYVVLFVGGYARLLRHPLSQNANGVILLATVSTQSIVLALATVFGNRFPIAIATGLVAFDMLFLCLGLVLIGLHYYAMRSWTLAVEWKNTNCIVHGAVSIIGLGLVLTSNFRSEVLVGVWGVAMVLFAVIETLEFVRLCEREYRRGFRRGLLVYDTTQWTRNFTFGMFYAFSLTLYRHPGVARSFSDSFWYPVLRAVADWGQYVVLAALLVEIALFLRSRLHPFRHAH